MSKIWRAQQGKHAFQKYLMETSPPIIENKTLIRVGINQITNLSKLLKYYHLY